MIKRKNIITVAIDSPAASGGGTQAKLISHHYSLLNVNTGALYRVIGKLKLENPKRFNYSLIKKKIKKLKIKDLENKSLFSDEIATSASIIAKDKQIRKIVHTFQINCAYNPPKKYKGSCLEGRDIGSIILPFADFKFFLTASTKTRALRRYKELKKSNKKLSFSEVLKSIKKRDKNDYNRKISPLKRTNHLLINCEKLSIRSTFLKIKKIMDKKLKA